MLVGGVAGLAISAGVPAGQLNLSSVQSKLFFLIAAFVSYRVLYMRPLSLVDRVFLRKCAVLF